MAHVTGARQTQAPGRKRCAQCCAGPGPGPGGIHPKPPKIGIGLKGAQTVIAGLTLLRHIVAIHSNGIQGRAAGAGPHASRWNSDCSPGILQALKPWNRRHLQPHVCTAQVLYCRLDRRRTANGQFSLGARANIAPAGNSLAQVIISDGSVRHRRRIRQSIGSDSIRAHAFRRTHESLLGLPVETH